MARYASPFLGVLLLQACAGPKQSSGNTPDDTDPPSRTFPEVIGGARPAPVVHPASFEPDETLPAVVLLHFWGGSALVEDRVFGLTDRVDADRFLLVMPDGTFDDNGSRHWNAGVDCCGDAAAPVDDVAYLAGLVDELRATWRVGTVTFVGHSNGGYMAYRLACDVPDKFDRMVVLAGSDPVVPPDCVQGHPIGLLHVHGTADDSVHYDADMEAVHTPGAVESVRRQAARTGCDTTTSDLGAADLLWSLDGEESTGVAYKGCPSPVALWTVVDGDHLFLTASESFRDGVAAFALGGAPTFP